MSCSTDIELCMRSPNKCEVPVLIVGAGPTGLVLALWLARLGVRARLIDKTAEPGTTSRALAVQVRTLELYQQIGLAEEVGRAWAAHWFSQFLGWRKEAGAQRRIWRPRPGAYTVPVRVDFSARRT